jgi:hypothetical protein
MSGKIHRSGYIGETRRDIRLIQTIKVKQLLKFVGVAITGFA